MWNHKYIFIAIFFSLNLFSQKYDKTVFDLVSKYENEIISLRHWFHENAELSNREFLTSEKIAEELKKIGLSPQTGIAKTGVVALLKGGKPGPVVGLRADIDGLPIKERVPIKWASKMIGEYNGESVPVMHACGHDTHIAILLGVAKVLFEIKDQIPGSVKFIFQPAEEGAPDGEEGGAELMVKEGVLKNPDVDAIFGLHIQSQIPVGQIYLRPNGIMAAVDSFRIDIEGVQTHGARPWAGADPIVTAAQMINSIQTIVSRNVPLTESPAVVSIGSIHGGVRSNIIPESLYMLGTIRTLDEDVRVNVLNRIKTIVKNIGEANNTNAKISFGEYYPITFNDPILYNSMLPSLKRINGEENVNSMNPVTGAEDFSFFQKEIPGLYFLIGGLPEGSDPSKAAPHHTPDFFVDDSGMSLGMRSMTILALDYMEKNLN